MRLQFLSNEIAFAILFLLKIYKNCVTAERTCHACHGINCLRTSYNGTQNCVDDFDICVTVFEGQTVMYQGCLEQLSEELRNKCNPGLQVIDQQNSPKLPECFKCNGNLCNNLASETFNCIQCDTNSDINCRSKPENLIPAKCLISRTPNEYCFTKREDDRIVRGCLQSLEQQAACLSSEDCIICQPSEISDCNNMVLDSNVNGSEGNEGGGSINGDGDGNGNDNSGSESSESGGDGSGNSTSGNDRGSNLTTKAMPTITVEMAILNLVLVLAMVDQVASLKVIHQMVPEIAVPQIAVVDLTAEVVATITVKMLLLAMVQMQAA